MFLQTNGTLTFEEPFNQPAKLAKRVLAPGDGEAEPGVRSVITVSLRSWRQCSRALKNRESKLFSHVSSVAHFVGWTSVGFGPPGSASPSPGASTLSARFAGSLMVPRTNVDR
jgi:hypothetical protein